ncbi:MAG TPA: sensor histidine kinase [Falsiroseomonas sp.]|jgi:two-component sensor histidine kinase|nr:sensor histidine kinase [Falsiroseomonas sp.]
MHDQHSGRPRWAAPVRLHLVLVVLAAVLPLLLLAGLLACAYVTAETERFERGVRDVSFAVALAIERDVTTGITVLRTLATSAALPAGNLAAFHAQASAVRDVLGANVILRTPQGQQLVSTFFPWGAPLASGSALRRWDPEALSSRQPLVTGHYVGLTGGAHSYAVIVPVERNGEVAWLLHASFDTRRLRDILAASRVPGDAVVSVSDRDRVILARRAGHEQAVGRVANAPDVRDEETVWRQTNREGREVFAALRRLPSSGWYVGVGVPAETLLAPLRRTIWLAAGAAAGLLALALVGVWFFARRLAGGITALAAHGAALEGGQHVPPPTTAVREVNEVGAALATAAARHGLMVHELNHRVRNTLATVDSMLRLSARHAGSVPDLEAGLSERIHSLGKTHVLLTGTHWTEAGLKEVLRNELAVHEAAGAGRVVIEGLPVMLPARQAVSLGMLAHELATNAAKHGSLSVPEGRVVVSWALAGGEGGALRLDLLWQESGGPLVTPPARPGFGTQLIERGIARDLGARVEAEYRPGGLRFRLSMPLAAPTSEPHEAAPPPVRRPVAAD